MKAIPVILQGDDTAANGRGLRLRMPDVDIGEGFSILLSFCGVERSGAYVPGGTLDFNWTRDETAKFPLGITYGTVKLEKEGLMQTITNTLPVKVTDCVTLADAIASAGGGNAPAGNTIDVQVVINTGVPKVDKGKLTKASTMGDIKALANALLEAINGAPGAEDG